MNHRFADLQIIVPAAGNSSRLGQPKQEVLLHDQPLWQYMTSLTQHLDYPMTVVTGAWRPSQPCGEHVSELYFPNWRNGLGATIAYAVQHILEPNRGYLIFLMDQWGLTEQSLRRFIEAWDGESIQMATDDAYAGPPVIFPTRYREDLIQLHGDHGAKAVMQHRHAHRLPVAQSAWDLDTPEDLFLLQQVTEQTGTEQ